MSQEDDDGVIRPDFQAPNSLRTVQTERLCKHRDVDVAQYSRTVTCHTCEAVLDPFQVILQYADGERTSVYFQKSVDELQDKIAELKIEERKIKARIKTAKKRAGQQVAMNFSPIDGDDR